MGYLAFVRANLTFLGAGALLSFGSTFGQTVFIAVFAAQIMAAFGLSDGQWGTLYAAATTVSAILMIQAGALTDRFRARALAAIVMPCLALACLGMALAPGPAILGLSVLALRLFGQGMMSQLAIVSTARWFVASRGRALAIVTLGFAVGQAALPMLFAAALGVADWRWLWALSAAITLALLPPLLHLLRQERTPRAVAEETEIAGMGNRHWRRAEVLRHPLFWCAVPLLLGPPAWGTALFFQQVHLAAVKNWPLAAYLALLPVYTTASIVTSLVSGPLIDRFGTARLMMAYMLPFAAGFAVMGGAGTLVGAAIALAILGCGSGLQATLPASFWAEFFGTRHLGAIKAMAAAIMVLGTAIGPAITGLLIDAGRDFPDQMLGISGYFLCAAALITLGLRAALRALPAPA